METCGQTDAVGLPRLNDGCPRGTITVVSPTGGRDEDLDPDLDRSTDAAPV
jgi:hypothetical protein